MGVFQGWAAPLGITLALQWTDLKDVPPLSNPFAKGDVMTNGVWPETEEIKSLQMQRPHLVILGAGASLAAFPSGDRNGRKLPVMRTFTDVVGLKTLLRDSGIPEPYENFEAIYSDIAVDSKRGQLKEEIESRVYTYFASLELPDEPTLYDHLVLSLRPKDVVATFNWDPFLCQAASRNHRFGGAPMLLFLHGNVAFAYCPGCKTGFPLQKRCCKCGRELLASPLLYPVKQKNYQKDEAIVAHWRTLERVLQGAWALTIFGYGAPKTDVEAVRLMKSAWGDTANRELEQTEIIDVRTENDLTGAWAPFIHSHHYDIWNSFYDCYIAKHPRRSGEALWAQLMECQFLESREFPRKMSFEDLYKWLRPRVEAESGTGEPVGPPDR